MPSRPAARGAAPKPSKTAAETERILAKLAAQHPNADTELNFTTPYELLVATILSAQCTDERVNQVTPALFKRYPDARALARATTGQLEPQIQSTGFFRAKSRSLVGMAAAVVDRHEGEVPKTMEELVQLPGVGRKTANVVLGHALGVPGLPVDRHVLRVANRIGIARSDDPEVVEQQLCAAMPSAKWTLTSDTLILHGRRICKPRPLCEQCAVREDCDYYRSVRKASSFQLPASGSKVRARGESGSVSEKRRAAEPPETDGGRRDPGKRSESGSLSEKRRAAEPRETDGGRRAPGNRPESRSLPEKRRAAQPRETDGGRRAPGNRSESGSLSEKRRAAEPRGTGRGGGAPRQTKK